MELRHILLSWTEKTTRSERIIDRHISWPTIREHRIKHKADYAVIVGPNFAGGDLHKRSITYETLLMRTDTLIELMKIHSSNPLTLTDLKDVFSNVGLLRLDECSELLRRKKEYEKYFNLIPKILYKLQQLQSQNEHTTVNDLRWALDREFNVKEISKAVNMLKKLDMVQQNENEEFISLITPRVAAAKLEALAKAIQIL